MSLDEGTLRCQLERFYRKVRTDEALGPIFADHVEDWHAHADRLSDFWSSVVCASGRYKGNPHSVHLPFVHQLTPERWLEVRCQAARENFSDETAAHLELKAQRIGGSLLEGLLFPSARKAAVGKSLPSTLDIIRGDNDSPY